MLFAFDAVSNGEEPDRRGFTLPHLQTRCTALRASLLLGVICGFRHLPAYVATSNGEPFAFTAVGTVAIAVPYTWIYSSARDV